MPTRRLEGAALLVAGHGAISASSFDASVVHTLGQIGESLLATGAGWQIRRLSSVAGERFNADRVTLKQHIDELTQEPVRIAMLVLLGVITDIASTRRTGRCRSRGSASDLPPRRPSN